MAHPPSDDVIILQNWWSELQNEEKAGILVAAVDLIKSSIVKEKKHLH